MRERLDDGQYSAEISETTTDLDVALDLLVNSHYRFQVAAVNEIGMSERSAVVEASTRPPTPPDQVQFDEVNRVQRYVYVNWIAPEDNGSDIVAYNV
jgi:hypothetical protein